ncbi:hypothetical protein MUK42_32723 [Musa troglodytarum]|uniref:Uncharacterized protein n=1 Tax=Musa troglodytarum TaxID=320322 RepID=A0A9E7FBY7_9LILI|nr:hypothetical protein MUK42_32723 [Musa troglodytarum]
MSEPDTWRTNSLNTKPFPFLKVLSALCISQEKRRRSLPISHLIVIREADNTAPTGMVTAQEVTISRTVSALTLLSPLAKPTPITAPTRVWVAEMGRPSFDATRTTEAAANSAANPLVGVSSVIFLPMVAMTRYPHIMSPATIPKPPQARTSVGMTISALLAPP